MGRSSAHGKGGSSRSTYCLDCIGFPGNRNLEYMCCCIGFRISEQLDELKARIVSNKLVQLRSIALRQGDTCAASMIPLPALPLPPRHTDSLKAERRAIEQLVIYSRTVVLQKACLNAVQRGSEGSTPVYYPLPAITNQAYGTSLIAFVPHMTSPSRQSACVSQGRVSE